jgi:hypothetical protein
VNTSRADAAAITSQPDSLKAAVVRMSAEQLRQILLAAFEEMDQTGRRAVLRHAVEMAAPRKRRTSASMAAIVLALLRAGHDETSIANITELSVMRIRKLIAVEQSS